MQKNNYHNFANINNYQNITACKLAGNDIILPIAAGLISLYLPGVL